MSICASTENRIPNPLTRRPWFGVGGQFRSEAAHRTELITSLVLTCACVGLHLLRLFRAGPLWRDEAAVVGLANLPKLSEVFAQFPHEAFPMLFPLTVRAVTHVGGNADLAFRVFGFVVGIGIVGALWSTMWLIQRRPPLLSLVLLGLNGAMIQWGDSLRGYGMGALFMVLTVGLVWRMAVQPGWSVALAAMVTALAVVQCLFHNPPLLFAICAAGMFVTLRRGSKVQTGLLLLIGLVAAASLLPYWGPLREARAWDEVVREQAGVGQLWKGLIETLGASAWSNIWIWAGLFLSAQWLCWHAQRTSPNDTGSRDLMLFCGVSLLVSLCGCLIFLKVLSYMPRPWYFLALLSTGSVLLDAVFVSLQQGWARVVRLTLIGAVALTSMPSAWRAASTRQSNLDVVAAELSRVSAQDLIVVRPWPLGIPFERYYTGVAQWMTVPAIEFHKFHRYDLVQAFMILPHPEDALQPVRERITATLKSGHTVWLVGQLAWSAAPSEVQTPESVKSLEWSRELGAFLRGGAQHLQTVPIVCRAPVNGLENLPLWKLDGWSGN